MMKTVARCERGTASVEIAVMLPVFMVLFFAAQHLHDAAYASQRALARARACAYHYAVHGCTQAAQRDPVCRGLSVGTLERIDGYDDDTRAHATYIDRLAEWPLFGTALQSLFGEGASSTASRTHRTRLGPSAGTTTQSFFMICNTVSNSFSGHASALLKDLADVE